MAKDVEIKVGVESSAAKKGLASINKSAKGLEDTFAGIAKVSGIVFAGLTASVGAFVAKAAEFEKVNTQFEVLTGSAEKAAQTVKELADFSAKTPFQFEDIAQAGQQLLGFGFQAEEVADKLQFIGDIAAASGTPITELGLIFGQVSAAGKLTGERLLQLQERAIPIGPAIAKTMGIAETAVRDAVSKGKVDFETFEKAFSSISKEGGQAFNGMAKQSATLSGKISTLKDNFSLLVADLGKQFAPIVKEAAQSLTEFIATLRENQEIVKYTAIVVGLTTAIAGLTAAVGTLGLALPAITYGLAALTGPIGIAVAAVGGLTAGFIALKNNMDDIEESRAAESLSEQLQRLITERERLTTTIEFGGKASRTDAISRLSDLQDQIDTTQELIRAEAARTREPVSLLSPGEEGAEDPAAYYSELFEIQQNYVEKTKEQQEELKAATRESLVTDTEEKVALKLEEQELLREIDAQFRQESDELKATEKALETAEGRTRLALLKKKLALQLSLEKKNNLLKLVEKKEFDKAKDKLQKEADQREANSEIARLKNQRLYTSASLQLATNLSNLSIAITGKKNKALFLIEKAAAIAQAVVSTNLAAAEALAIPPAPNVALSSLALAAGGAQIATIAATAIQGFAKGGLAEGGTLGKDSIPAMLAPGELVVPRTNFDEVISAVSNQRAGVASAAEGEEGSGGIMEVLIGFKDEAFELIEEKLIERQRLGISTL